MPIKEKDLTPMYGIIISYINDFMPNDPLHPIVVTMIAHFIANAMKDFGIYAKSNNSATGGQVLGLALKSLRKTADEIEAKLSDIIETDKTLV